MFITRQADKDLAKTCAKEDNTLKLSDQLPKLIYHLGRNGHRPSLTADTSTMNNSRYRSAYTTSIHDLSFFWRKLKTWSGKHVEEL